MSKKRILLMTAAQEEVARARILFPSSDHLTLALAEEAGEVVKAALDHREKGGTLHDVDTEIIQLMAMCIRLWEEGDPSINLPPCTAL